MERRPKILQQGTLLLLSLAAITAVSWFLTGEALLLSIYEGRFHPGIDGLVQQHKSLDPTTRDYGYYLDMAKLLLMRCGLLFIGSIGIIWLFWPHLKKRLTAFRNENVAPEQLAVFRILVFGVLLLYPNYTAIFRMSALPVELIVAPPGLSAVLHWLPPTPFLAKLTGSLYVLGSLGALIGYRTRFMAVLATLSGIYFLGIPQFYGKIDHYHHLLWFSALAAFGPVSDRWSFDAWRKPYFIIRPPQHYALLLQLLVALLALIYFFAGWWKIIGGGMDWVWGDGAWLHIEAQAFRLGTTSPLWLANNGFLKSSLGLATLLLELGWGYAVLSRRFRPLVLAVALFFHGSVYWLMQINFWQLPVFYLVFLPWGELLGQTSSKIQHLMPNKQTSLRWVGGILILGNGLCGLAHLNSWPFAVYPSFGNPPENRVKYFYLVSSDTRGIRNINLQSDPELRNWLPKTRLQGLHEQLLRAPDSILHTKLEHLLPLYLGALQSDKLSNLTVVTRIIDLENREVILTEMLTHVDAKGHFLD